VTSLPSLYRERVPLFKKYADYTIDAERKSAEKIADEILALFAEKKPLKSRARKG